MPKLMTKEFPAAILREYILEGEDYVSDDLTLAFVEEGVWRDEGKYSYKEYYFEHEGVFYCVSDSRAGSYFSDYYYGHSDWSDMVECIRVEKRSVVRQEWEVVYHEQTASPDSE